MDMGCIIRPYTVHVEPQLLENLILPYGKLVKLDLRKTLTVDLIIDRVNILNYYTITGENILSVGGDLLRARS